jgi:F-type H+-transporting ATPase subunit c
MKAVKLALVMLSVLLLMAAPAFGYVTKNKNEKGEMVETGGPDSVVLSGGGIAAGLGAGLTIIGAGIGFGRIGAAALDGMARQPEVAGRVQTAMLIIAALLEGVTFFSLIVCIIAGGHAGL